MKILYSFLTALAVIFTFYLSIPPNNPSEYMQSVCVLIEDMDGSGSGLVILHKGKTYVLTCAHVLTNFFGFNMPVNVVHNIYKNNKLVAKHTYVAKVKFKDRLKDIAILSIEGKTHFKNTIHITKGIYYEVGKQIWMVGSPYGNYCYNTVSKGIVARHDYNGFFRYQVDCGVYSGGSGGGMFDDNGSFGGMFSSFRNPTVGYVIPVQVIRSFMWKNCPELLY